MLKMMKTSSGKVRKRKSTQSKRHALRGAVLKMLAVMENNPESATTSTAAPDQVAEFLVTGRTGRRNAMADILGQNANTSSGDLPERLQSLTTVDPEAGPSGSNQESKGQFEASTSTAGTSSASGSKTSDQSKAEGNS